MATTLVDSRNGVAHGDKSNGSIAPSKSTDKDLSSVLGVHKSPDAFGSYAFSKVSLPAGSFFARITNPIPTSTIAYTSVQVSRDKHIELNSDLVYTNHSCDPNLEYDMERFEVRVGKDRDLRKGEKLGFFYPSTEWEMVQPFECNCGSERCIGLVEGANKIDSETLRGYWLNRHIAELVAERERSRS
ncbi:hypothetical protein LTR66_006867 [Elasticomyces elasticus]|nr:hypothetical protein LTR66_006867 [Elasticomyces elasticus]